MSENERREPSGTPATGADGPTRETWEKALDATITLMGSGCGWLELVTRAILEQRGTPYGKGFEPVEPPRIPSNQEIAELTGRQVPEPANGRYELPPSNGTDDDEDDTADGTIQEARSGDASAAEDKPDAAPARTKTDGHDDESGEKNRQSGSKEGTHGEDARDDGATTLSDSEEHELSADESRALTSQYGTRVGEDMTYYPNLAAFVELWLANVFPYQQGPSVNMKWVKDWWRYPALVFPLDALWRAYENARRQPGQMMIFYIQCSSVIDRLFNKDTGIVKSLETEQLVTLNPGDPLPCERPPRAWRKPILERMDPPGASKRAVAQHQPARPTGETRRTIRNAGNPGRK